mgnify:CR=1 FL=1
MFGVLSSGMTTACFHFFFYFSVESLRCWGPRSIVKTPQCADVGVHVGVHALINRVHALFAFHFVFLTLDVRHVYTFTRMVFTASYLTVLFRSRFDWFTKALSNKDYHCIPKPFNHGAEEGGQTFRAEP